MLSQMRRVMFRLSRVNEYRQWFVLALALGAVIISMPGGGGGGGV